MRVREILVGIKEDIGAYISPIVEGYFTEYREEKGYSIYIEDLTYIETLVDECLIKIEDEDRLRSLFEEIHGFYKERIFKGATATLLSTKFVFILEELSEIIGADYNG
jgi:hypothetical protein